MKAVILGAGASYDSIFDFHDPNNDGELWRPPLANGLFQNRPTFLEIIEKYTGAKSLAPNINLNSDIEVFLENLYRLSLANTSHTDALRQIISTQFYLQELCSRFSEEFFKSGQSCYTALINRANAYAVSTNNDVCFITFNYDILFEKAYKEISANPIDNMDAYVNSYIKLIKLHGSCNWASEIKDIYDINKVRPIHDLLYNSPKTPQLRSNIEVRDYTRRHYSDAQTRQTTYYFPRISIPLKNKSDFVAPDQHIEIAKTFLRRVNDLLIIGWKGGEQKFISIMQSEIGTRPVNITVVNEQGGNQLKAYLQTILPQCRIQVFNQPSELDKQKSIEDGTMGGFSAYVINVERGVYEDFFSKK